MAFFMETISDIQQLPELGKNSIHIWGIHLPDIQGRLDDLHEVLCEKEQKKAARFYSEADRKSSISARGALRLLLSGYTSVPPGEVEFRYLETGKPYVEGSAIDFNVSHSGEWVVLAFGRNRQIGVDVEKIKRDMDVEAIATRYFTPEETALIKRSDDSHSIFFQLWARKEAYVKACGSALFRELSTFSVPLENGELPDRGVKDGWIFHRLEAGSKYAAAVVSDKKMDAVPCYDFGGLKWDN